MKPRRIRGKKKGRRRLRRTEDEAGVLKKERERSGSPALLALRRLKARESARPRTRPGRDLLPSSFLHPALSLPSSLLPSPRHPTASSFSFFVP